MACDPVWGFFYGGLINPEVQARVGLTPLAVEPASVAGFQLVFEPWVNLRPHPAEVVFGLLMQVDPEDLAAAYGKLAARYLPHPVAAVRADGTVRSALCYISPGMDPGAVDRDHVMALLTPAQALGFPPWHLERIRAALPSQ